MTFSIIARCPRTGQFGIAATTGVPAVGKLLTHAAAGVGAVATQARVNPYLGIDGLACLRDGMPAREARNRLIDMDPAIQNRQFALIDRHGDTAVWTGDDCLDWAGSMEGDGYSLQGNRLAGETVLADAAAAYESGAETPLADRLLAAIVAGDLAGGDRKGERSATIYIVDTEDYPLWDIRVDEHEAPVEELQRLHALFAREVIPEIRRMPTRENMAGEAGEDPI
ncbi:MAG: DUF1028 domain-containing protein [Aurantimonas endophytica]|uniref:DUF1028 domain-containing protein n=1 Tax=Aurantimonas endophytica TaxID=1522175 RepID=UPI003002DEE9